MKKLNELTIDELKIVFENNDNLQKDVFYRMFNDIDFWNEEYLSCWNRGAIDYCIGYDRGTYFECIDKSLFLQGLQKAQKDYYFLSDKYNSIIEYTGYLWDRFLYIQDELNDKNYNLLECRIFELIEKLEKACYSRFMDEYEYCFGYENQLNYFLDFYIDDLSDNFYVDDNYILYEHIKYEKSYN
jgi:hypothetical protein